ncbi:Uma2 family endonuclease [Kitasatospora sp. DSM 101779]|uniref:Uma2 family endonuclease n=1 Tax=Kitasatospora sp. DSM 101779 TaxID=2853165 RepID=UPI0021DA3207|nr:Uma2 family endonuclease [Kitasatospora sp. DSM 101779]MCU7823348.1 Uma2 family endonuclease [Kitasatospora sp. DSM 101779]
MLEALYVPDLAVLAVTAGDVPGTADLMIAVEVASPGTAELVRTEKLRGYAHAPVPLFLQVDRFDGEGPTVTLLSEPDRGRYQRGVRTPFGRPVALPAPFAIDLGTEGFPVGK